MHSELFNNPVLNLTVIITLTFIKTRHYVSYLMIYMYRQIEMHWGKGKLILPVQQQQQQTHILSTLLSSTISQMIFIQDPQHGSRRHALCH